MKKISFKTILISVAAVAMALVFATQASAMTPSLALTNTGSNLQINVYGDANASVILDYYSGNQLVGAGIIGYTNYSGYFSSTINPYQYNIPNGAQAIVVVNGQQSGAVTWISNTYNNGGYNNNCYVYPYNCNNNTGYNNNQITLSQSNINMTVGQSQSISIYNNGGYNTGYNQYYISNNNSTGTVSATISGNTLNLYAQNTGSASFSVCSYSNGYNNSGCATVYVTVTGYYNNGGYNNTCYQYPYNCNTNYCYQTYPYNCNNGGYNNGGYYNSPITVSNSNVQVTVGNSGSVVIYGNTYNNGYNNGYNQYYVTSSNSNVANATVNGSTLSIYGTNAGSTTITVCSSNGGGQCATVYVTVTAPVYIYNSPYNYPTQPGNWQYSYQKKCWYQY